MTLKEIQMDLEFQRRVRVSARTAGVDLSSCPRSVEEVFSRGDALWTYWFLIWTIGFLAPGGLYLSTGPNPEYIKLTIMLIAGLGALLSFIGAIYVASCRINSATTQYDNYNRWRARFSASQLADEIEAEFGYKRTNPTPYTPLPSRVYNNPHLVNAREISSFVTGGCFQGS